MINLMAILGLNTTPFKRGLASAVDSAKGAGNVMGKEVSKDFTKGLKRTIGAAAIVAGIAAEFTRTQSIGNAAKAVGMTAQEFAALEIITDRYGDTSELTADQIKDMTDALINSGQVPSETVLQTMTKQANEAEAAMRSLRVAMDGVLVWFVQQRGGGRRLADAFGDAGSAFWSHLKNGGLMVDAFGSARKAFSNTLNLEKSVDLANAGGGDPLDKFGNVRKSQRERRAKEDWDLMDSITRDMDELDMTIKNAEFNSRKKYLELRRPQSISGTGELASMGLGNARGSFGIEAQMLSEQRKSNKILTDQKKILQEKL